MCLIHFNPHFLQVQVPWPQISGSPKKLGMPSAREKNLGKPVAYEKRVKEKWDWYCCGDFRDAVVSKSFWIVLNVTGSSSHHHVKLEDLIHQHVLYVLRKNPDVARHVCRFFIVPQPKSHINEQLGRFQVYNSCNQGFHQVSKQTLRISWDELIAGCAVCSKWLKEFIWTMARRCWSKDSEREGVGKMIT